MKTNDLFRLCCSFSKENYVSNEGWYKSFQEFFPTLGSDERKCVKHAMMIIDWSTRWVILEGTTTGYHHELKENLLLEPRSLRKIKGEIEDYPQYKEKFDKLMALYNSITKNKSPNSIEKIPRKKLYPGGDTSILEKQIELGLILADTSKIGKVKDGELTVNENETLKKYKRLIGPMIKESVKILKFFVPDFPNIKT